MRVLLAFVLASALLVVVIPPTASVPLKAFPVGMQTELGAQKNMDIHLPEGATSVTAETINHLSIVFADTVYIMSDGTVAPENPSTTLPPPFTTLPTLSTGTPGPTNPTGGPIITPPTFPGRK